MNSSEIINEDFIELNVRARSKEDALREVAKVAFHAGRVKDIASYHNGLLEREDTSTTGFGGGIAIPHAKINDVLKPSVFVVKLEEPVEWNAMDDKPVQLLIALAVPTEQEGTQHLKLLAKLSENLMEEDFTDSLLFAKTEQEIYTVIKNIFE
ncbi:PTS sugar transporter subunit IIA [Virgibacillus sp. CBA3643]|uniref:PTS sugar transporter subunit IIA n=1 Tax=Virgibacillus sp. CBA3643 TaxID=2942278 RepID=UPI0035A2AC15